MVGTTEGEYNQVGVEGKSTKLEVDLIALQDTLHRVQGASWWELEKGLAPFFNMACGLSRLILGWGTSLDQRSPTNMDGTKEAREGSV